MKVVVTALVAVFLCAAPAVSHEWYSKRVDPVTGGRCCGGSDCAQLVIEPGVLSSEADGYRIRLTLAQALRLNPHRLSPVDTLIPWARIQPSEDGNFHMCIPPNTNPAMRSDIYCFFAPPDT